MSAPTYRIELEYDAETDTAYKWNWYLWRVSDDASVGNGYETTRGDATAAAQRAIVRLGLKEDGETLYADDDGNIVDTPEPQSLRVAE